MDNNNRYLIPANSNKSRLILNLFLPLDLWILITGITITFILLMFVKSSDFFTTIMLLVPALVAIFLVLPIPNYHNMRCLIRNVYSFFTNRRRYYWKGWCASDGDRNK